MVEQKAGGVLDFLILLKMTCSMIYQSPLMDTVMISQRPTPSWM